MLTLPDLNVLFYMYYDNYFTCSSQSTGPAYNRCSTPVPTSLPVPLPCPAVLLHTISLCWKGRLFLLISLVLLCSVSSPDMLVHYLFLHLITCHPADRSRFPFTSTLLFHFSTAALAKGTWSHCHQAMSCTNAKAQLPASAAR